MADLADTLRTIPLFSALSREDIAKVLGRLEEKSFPAGTTIFSQGEKGDSFYFIQSGAVQVVLESAGGRKENIPRGCFISALRLARDSPVSNSNIHRGATPSTPWPRSFTAPDLPNSRGFFAMPRCSTSSISKPPTQSCKPKGR